MRNREVLPYIELISRNAISRADEKSNTTDRAMLILSFFLSIALPPGPVCCICILIGLRKALSSTMPMTGVAISAPAIAPVIRVERRTCICNPDMPTASCHIVLSPRSIRRLYNMPAQDPRMPPAIEIISPSANSIPAIFFLLNPMADNTPFSLARVRICSENSNAVRSRAARMMKKPRLRNSPPKSVEFAAALIPCS